MLRWVRLGNRVICTTTAIILQRFAEVMLTGAHPSATQPGQKDGHAMQRHRFLFL